MKRDGWVWAGAAILGALVLATGRMFANILPRQVIRVDAAGDGHYGASRTGHIHQGIDLLVSKGDAVRSPVDGRVVRITNVYTDSAEWKGVVLSGEGTEWKIFYLLPSVAAGDFVERGQVVGYAQAISQRYNNPAMQDHVHVEVRAAGVPLDPATRLSIA